MKMYKYLKLTVVLLLVSCTAKQPIVENNTQNTDAATDFTIAFGSCNRQTIKNKLWPAVLEQQPDLWIWGGDIIYADTKDMQKMANDYKLLKDQPHYQTLVKTSKILGTWDDHDYGLNDAGEEYEMKVESQQLFLDFLDVPQNHARRNREGVYHSEVFKSAEGSVKVIVLDTRYFRTALTKSTTNNRRYQPNKYGEGTILGEAQWQWLQEELTNSKANFNVIVSSIQVLSGEHQFEKWANFPHETERLLKLIENTKPNATFVISGDRHISEFSKVQLEQLNYPLIDFTSSGLTHVYSGFSGEPNKNRVGDVVFEISFGVLKFDFRKKSVIMEMRGENNKIIQTITQAY